MIDNERYLKVSEICHYLAVSDETVYRWIRENGLPARKVGKRWMFRREEIDVWIEKGGSLQKESSRKNN